MNWHEFKTRHLMKNLSDDELRRKFLLEREEIDMMRRIYEAFRNKELHGGGEVNAYTDSNYIDFDYFG